MCVCDMFAYTSSHDGMSLVFVASGGNHLRFQKGLSTFLVKNMRCKSRREREACRLIASHRHSKFGTTCAVDHMFETDLYCCTKIFMDVRINKVDQQTLFVFKTE